MRNLHHDRVYSHTDWFLEILSNLNINVSPKADERVLRRFIMGHNHNPVSTPVRTEVKRTVDVSATFEESCDINVFFENAKESVLSSLLMKNIELKKVTNINFEGFSQDDENMLEITFISLETDSELAKRQQYAELFNTILFHKITIYEAVDKKLAEIKNTHTVLDV
jgi:hypothetical protein